LEFINIYVLFMWVFIFKKRWANKNLKKAKRDKKIKKHEKKTFLHLWTTTPPVTQRITTETATSQKWFNVLHANFHGYQKVFYVCFIKIMKLCQRVQFCFTLYMYD